MQDKIIQLAKYLYTKGVITPLKLQKMLFFIRYEELLNGSIENSCFEPNYNFQAWIYGPVNEKSYKFMQMLFWSFDEKDEYLLKDDEMKVIDLKYGKYFNKWNKLSSDELAIKSRKNKAWINAREGLMDDEPSNKSIDESSLDFLEFIE